MSEIDDIWERVRNGDHEAFADWVRFCEPDLRKSLRSFASRVDVESVVQEGLLRMWVLAPTRTLTGENASFRFALRLVRNLALSWLPREDRDDDGPVVEGGPPGPPNEGLMQAIRNCLDKLPPKPREAILGRLRGISDRDLADLLGMTINPFHQNIVRARKLLWKCLEGAGFSREEYSR